MRISSREPYRGQGTMRDLQIDRARAHLERQLSNYLKTAACLPAGARAHAEVLAALVREELAECDAKRRGAAIRTPGAAYAPRPTWPLRPGRAGRRRHSIDRATTHATPLGTTCRAAAHAAWHNGD